MQEEMLIFCLEESVMEKESEINKKKKRIWKKDYSRSGTLFKIMIM